MKEFNLKNYDKQKDLEVIYILGFSIAFITRIGRFEMNYFVKYIIASLWIGIAFLQLLENNCRVMDARYKIKFYFKLFLIPYIIMSTYNIFLFITKNAEIITLGRSISYIVSMIITIIAVFASIYLLKQRALTCTIYSMFLSFIIVIIFNIFTNSSDALRGLVDTFVNNSQAINYFELHDITFAFGLIFLLYIIREDKLTYGNLNIIIGSIFIMLMGFKRIQLISIAITIIYIFIIKNLKEDTSKKIVKITGICLIIICILYVWVIDVGILDEVMKTLGINTMGRLSFYNWICTYAEFKADFLGVGLGSTSKLMEVYTGWSIATIHSDILRMFVEIGFIGFILWLWYYILYSYKSICKELSIKVGITYFILTMYLYLLHFTDNTVTYFVTQYVYMLIIISISHKEDNIYEDTKLTEIKSIS